MGRRGNLGVGIALAIAAALLFAGIALPAVAHAAPMYWGGTIKGDVYGIGGEAPNNPQVLENFERDGGRTVSMINTGQNWADFDLPTMEKAIANGIVPLVTMNLQGTTLAEVISGRQDSRIRAWATAAREFGYPFLFRPWWEVNGTWYPWGRSPEYIAAWRHFHDVVEEVGATNVTWAWIVNTVWYEPQSKPAPWYPGNEYVDWVGMDAYNWGKNPVQPDRWVNAEESIQPTLNELEAIAPGKPVCICESASTEYGEGGPNQTKATWIHEMLTQYLPAHPEIQAYLWFNWNVEKDGGTPGARFDWPIESSPASEVAFREGISNPMYLPRAPHLTKLTKVPPPSAGAAATVAEVFGPVKPAGTPGAVYTTSPNALKPRGSRGVSAARAGVTFGKARPGKRPGTAKLAVAVPGAGSVRISGDHVRIRVLPSHDRSTDPVTRRLAAATKLTIEVGATGGKRRELRARGKAHVSLTVRFTPGGGDPVVGHRQLTLRTARSGA
jgi:hypothetical protein